MSENIQLTATAREKVGKGAARAARRQGMIPAVIYGGKEPPIAISLPFREIDLKISAGGFMTTVADISVDGQVIRTLPRDFQRDPVSDKPLHVDFLRISAGSTITVEVPVQFINEEDSPGIRRGGVLNVVRHTVELECPADGIPEHIIADLTGLDINDSLHISSVSLPENVKTTIDRDFTVATIAAPAGIKEEIRAAAEAAAEEAAEGEATEEGAEGDDEEKND
jgi:large subunit ribosomal protein L25